MSVGVPVYVLRESVSLIKECGHPAGAGRCAGVAQLVEHVLGKDGVTGSNPVSS